MNLKNVGLVLSGFVLSNILTPSLSVISFATDVPATEKSVEMNKVKSIIVEGISKNTITNEDVMKYVTKTVIGQEYKKENVEYDLLNLINSGIVQNAKAKTIQSNGELCVIFEIEEITAINKIKFEGISLVNQDELKATLITKEGENFNKANIDKDIENIKSFYAKKNLFAVVTNINFKNKGEITFVVSEAQIEKIQYIGNTKTKDWVIDKIVKPIVKDKDHLSPENLKELYNKLMQTGYFESVDIQAEDGNVQGNILLKIIFKELKSGEWNIGGGYSERYKGQLVGGVKDKNLNGEAKEFGLDFSLGSNKNSYQLSYLDNYYKKTDTSISFNLFNTKSDETYLDTTYEEKRTGFNIGMAKPISEDKKTKFFANFNSDNIKVENVSGGNIEGVKTNSISLGIINDRRDNPTDTKNGSLVKAEILSSQKLFGSDYNFTKLMVDARKYVQLSPKDVFASRIMFNYSNNSLPLVEQFSIGGSESVRGLDEGEQKGNKSILASVEYRHDLSDKVQAVVFVDAGKAMQENIDNTIKVSTGLGLRIKTAMGMIRLDAAKTGGHSAKYMFGFGQAF